MRLHRKKTMTKTLMLVPMVDMLTTILIFLLFNFTTQEGRAQKSKEIKVPKSTSMLHRFPPIQVEVTASYVMVNGKKLDGLQPEGAEASAWQILSAKLTELKQKDQPVLMIADQQTNFGFVDKAVGQVAAAGFSEIYFLTEEVKEGKK